MPKSRGRRQSSGKPGLPAASGTSARAATPQSAKGYFRAKSRAVWGIISVGAVLLAYAVLLPRMSIMLGAVPQPSDPFSGSFRLINNQFYSIRSVDVRASLWCFTIGGQASNPPPIDNAHCLPSMKLSKPDWHNHALEADEGWDLSLAGLFAVSQPSALRYADAVITVYFRPWFWPSFIPFPLSPRDFRFYTRRLDAGGVEWLEKPLDRDQVPSVPSE